MGQRCPNITCPGGEVRGKLSLSSAPCAKPVFTYARIPFGKAPQRFMRPEPAEPWKGVLDGSGHSSIPMQFVAGTEAFQQMSPTKTDTKGLEKLVTEDCLHVTVYTTTTRKDANLPVMVWIYGGMLQMGFSDDYNGTTLAALHDVVVVVPNYRVGVFGFFSLDDPICPGNCGLFDQLLALEWVRDNIHCFGGNKDNVTIFGESAGATAVDQLVNSPLCAGLFCKAITESGQATNPKLYQEDYKESRKHLLERLQITAESPAAVLKKLQDLDAQTLLMADGYLAQIDKSFYCSKDGEFIVKSPWQTMKDKDFNKVSYLIGCNDSEYKGQLPHFSQVPNFFEGMTREAETAFLSLMPGIPKSAIDEVLSAVYKNYDNYPPSLPQNYSQQCGEILTDYIFNIPAINAARAHVDAGSDVYFYYATFQPRCNHDPAYGPHVGRKPDWCQCDHGDDLSMVFGVPFNPGTLSGGARFAEEEVELSLKFMKYFTQFAKTGNPNSGDSSDEEWPRQTARGEYLEMKTGSLAEGTGLKRERAHFWNEEVPKIIGSDDRRDD